MPVSKKEVIQTQSAPLNKEELLAIQEAHEILDRYIKNNFVPPHTCYVQYSEFKFCFAELPNNRIKIYYSKIASDYEEMGWKVEIGDSYIKFN